MIKDESIVTKRGNGRLPALIRSTPSISIHIESGISGASYRLPHARNSSLVIRVQAEQEPRGLEQQRSNRYRRGSVVNEATTSVLP